MKFTCYEHEHVMSSIIKPFYHFHLQTNFSISELLNLCDLETR